eukprot:TRINITY_DN42112_c0_g1_i1.p1 TRINITY_DN42112_c0_g1~~TRINITY_DN42112_c0_g1_i1.p1  ORF type:complete len:380 (-),score=45.14 TRINITY_DN42112_c0_g1_i1:546-1544(-)
MLASNIRCQELCRSKKEGPCIRRTQYYDGDAYRNNYQGNGNGNHVSHGADVTHQMIDLKSVEGILEFVQCVSPGHATKQKGITWLNGKMQLVEESATPLNVTETVAVKITEETRGQSQTRGLRRCPSSSASSKRSESNGRSSSKGSSSADSSSKTAGQPSTPQATPSMHSLLAASTSVSAAQAEQQQKRPPSLKRLSSACVLSLGSNSGPAPPTPSLSQSSRLLPSGSVGSAAQGNLRRSASSGAISPHERVCWGDPSLALPAGSSVSGASGSRPESAARQRQRPQPLGKWSGRGCGPTVSVTYTPSKLLTVPAFAASAASDMSTKTLRRPG